jgi:hypothetical protein
MTTQEAFYSYIVRLGDDSLILGQRLSEWCGHGPAIEEDIAPAARADAEAKAAVPTSSLSDSADASDDTCSDECNSLVLRRCEVLDTYSACSPRSCKMRIESVNIFSQKKVDSKSPKKLQQII